MHSVRIELAKLISVGTRITYQATKDAGSILYVLVIIMECSSAVNVIMMMMMMSKWIFE